MIKSRMVPPLLLAVIATLAGCQRGIRDDSIVFDPAYGTTALATPVGFPEADSERKIRVEISSATPINVDLVFAGDREKVAAARRAGEQPAAEDVVTSKEDVTTATLEATVPAGKTLDAVLSGAKERVQIKIKSSWQ